MPDSSEYLTRLKQQPSATQYLARIRHTSPTLERQRFASKETRSIIQPVQSDVAFVLDELKKGNEVPFYQFFGVSR